MPLTIFSPEQLNAVVAETIPQLPEGHTNAIVGTIDQQGAKVVAVMSFDHGHWTLNGAFEHDWGGDNKVGASLLGSW